jgi:hypothetical protein
MNEFLAELYNTADNIGATENLEKDAAAEFLVKLAADEGVDLDSLSDEEVAGLLTEIEKDASVNNGGETQEIDDEAQEKLAEADFLGRTMAHAYVDELSTIEKQAGRVTNVASKGYAALKKALGRAGEWAGASKVQRGVSRMRGGAPGGIIASPQGRAGAEAAVGKTELKSGLKRFAKRVGIPLTAMAATAGGYKAYKGPKEKKSFNEEFEDAAQQRAYEMLADAGYDVEKVAQADVDTRALQMLEEAGYPVQWNQ